MKWHVRRANVEHAAPITEMDDLLAVLRDIEPKFRYPEHATSEDMKRFPALMKALQGSIVSPVRTCFNASTI